MNTKKLENWVLENPHSQDAEIVQRLIDEEVPLSTVEDLMDDLKITTESDLDAADLGRLICFIDWEKMISQHLWDYS